MNKKASRKLRIEDITYYSKQREHPFSYSKSPIKKCSPQITQYQSRQMFNSLSSPSNCSSKARGIMREAIAKRIEYYKNDYKKKHLRKTIEEMKEEAKGKEQKELREAPFMNKQSQKIYQKVREKRNLSPNVLVRFQQYERSKTLKKLKLKIQKYYKQTRKIPRPQQIISPQKLGEMQQAKKLIDSLQQNIKKYTLTACNKQN